MTKSENESHDQSGDATEKKPYVRPRIVSSELLELTAAFCDPVEGLKTSDDFTCGVGFQS